MGGPGSPREARVRLEVTAAVGFGLGSSMQDHSRRREKRWGLARQSKKNQKKQQEIKMKKLHTLEAERRHGPTGDLRYTHRHTHTETGTLPMSWQHPGHFHSVTSQQQH